MFIAITLNGTILNEFTYTQLKFYIYTIEKKVCAFRKTFSE